MRVFQIAVVMVLVRLVEGEERWEVLDHPQGILQNWDGTEKIVLSPRCCSKLRLMTDVYPAFCRDVFYEPQSDIVRQVALATTSKLAPNTPLTHLNYHTNRRTLSLNRFNLHRLPVHGGSSEAPGLEPAKSRHELMTISTRLPRPPKATEDPP
ncbi:hypothetical protein TNCV_3999041 [Trichonephila clavipes]|nr:hypothetical protein TNCV_3999041 [Trichonephila clavipes]